MSQDSSVGIETGYVLGGRSSMTVRIEGFVFFTVSVQAPGHTQPPIPWGKAAGATLITHVHLVPRL
jgi:hypothetical protein